ncbi:MAG: terminase family protein [Bacilli bacterium]
MSKLKGLSQERQKELELATNKIAQNHLIDFAIATDRNYQDSWFHEKLASVLEDAVLKLERGEDVRIIIECPPQHGKSEIATKKFPAWCLGKHTDWPVMVGSYSGDLAFKFGQETRDIINSSSYQSIFNTKLSQDTKAKGYWKTQHGGSYMATGAGGAFTGMGFKIGIVDDLFKNREEAESQVVRDSRWSWYLSTFYTRQRGNTAIIVIGTRWHTDDVIGRLKEKEKKDREEGIENYDRWQVLRFPAIAEQDEEFRKKGEALWPERFSFEKLEKTKNTLGPYEFSALYQASPITSENQEFKQNWIKYRTIEEVLALNTRKIATIDPGGRELENDYTGIIRNYIDKQNFWNIRAIRVHIDSAELINYIFKLHEEGFEKIGIEETVYLKAIKPFFDMETRKRNMFPNIVPLKHEQRKKEIRIRGLIPRYSTGSIYHVENECRELEEEMFMFPKGIHDDTIDALAYQNDIAPVHSGSADEQFYKARQNNMNNSTR